KRASRPVFDQAENRVEPIHRDQGFETEVMFSAELVDQGSHGCFARVGDQSPVDCAGPPVLTLEDSFVAPAVNKDQLVFEQGYDIQVPVEDVVRNERGIEITLFHRSQELKAILGGELELDR